MNSTPSDDVATLLATPDFSSAGASSSDRHGSGGTTRSHQHRNDLRLATMPSRMLWNGGEQRVLLLAWGCLGPAVPQAAWPTPQQQAE